MWIIVYASTANALKITEVHTKSSSAHGNMVITVTGVANDLKPNE